MEKTTVRSVACESSAAAADCLNPTVDRKLRRLALQIAMQLPENAPEALRVLEYAREVVEGFLVPQPAGRPALARQRVPLRPVS